MTSTVRPDPGSGNVTASVASAMPKAGNDRDAERPCGAPASTKRSTASGSTGSAPLSASRHRREIEAGRAGAARGPRARTRSSGRRSRCAPKSEHHCIHCTGAARKSCGAASARSMPVVIGIVSSPISPMSWYSGSHDTPAVDAGLEAGRLTIASAFAVTQRCGRITPRGSRSTRSCTGGSRALRGRRPGGRTRRRPALRLQRVEQHDRRIAGDRCEELGELRVDDDEHRVRGEDAGARLRDELVDRCRAASGAGASPSRHRTATWPGSR